MAAGRCGDSDPLSFSPIEKTVSDLQLAFTRKQLTSKQLTEFYLARIERLNPVLRAVIEVNPDAISQAEEADRERRRLGNAVGELHGIPVLLKDNIGTKDRLNTSAGSLALVGSVVARDAGVVARLRRAGAVILGKASLSEWAHLRGSDAPSGWCARTGQGKNPYNLSADPCGSSSGSAISVAANLAAVSLGTETDGSIICPSSMNAVVGIKPTVGLTSRSGVVPITPRQDTIGPMCRTVSDAVKVLDVIVGFDPYDAEATTEASKYIPAGGYRQFLRSDGLRGKRLGIIRDPFFKKFSNGSLQDRAFAGHFNTLREKGAILVDNMEMGIMSEAYTSDWETEAMMTDFKIALNAYLKDLVVSPIRSLEDAIAFNNEHAVAVCERSFCRTTSNWLPFKHEPRLRKDRGV
ncbi:probable amidase At4g34880 isoform X2 [Punica granatum]|uniref:Probable amidase At4g34880 isoform X2 n=1 Tax=Punica granatum TaxID=22663 RepID=A0A6P8CLF4_PUNGR|nr:probable amidase At4g34880 isoform X2 [Punica granatum]